MAKFCIICGNVIYDKARKYCPNCKRKEHLEQMAKYYRNHQDRWMLNGLYWDQQRHNKFGTGNLGAHRLKNFKKEQKQIEKELQFLNLRDKKENWRYKNAQNNK